MGTLFHNLGRWHSVKISAGAMVFGGVVPYIPQYRTIARSGNTDGFSPMVCFVLLMANSLRILFWFGKHFELPLLAQVKSRHLSSRCEVFLQSFIMVVAMIAMVELCVRVRSKQETATKEHHFLGSKSVFSHVKYHLKTSTCDTSGGGHDSLTLCSVFYRSGLLYLT